jgi:hypothetical protein
MTTRPGMSAADVRRALYGPEAMRAGEPAYRRGECPDHGAVALERGRCSTCGGGVVVLGSLFAQLRIAAHDKAHDLALLEDAARNAIAAELVEVTPMRGRLYRPSFRPRRRA